MKKIWKTVGILSGIAACLILLVGGSLYAKLRSETAGMTVLETGEAAPGVYAVRDGYVNFFLVKGSDGYVAVDAGDDAGQVRRELGKLGIDAGQVKTVFLTHTDRDHIAGLAVFGKAKVYISKEEEQMVNGKTHRFFSLMKNSLPVRYETMEDGREVDASGVRIRGILTPGHTPGAMSYLADGRFLFTGDSMSLKEGRAGLFNEFFNMDSETQKKSLRKLKNVPGIQSVFTAHYGSTSDPGRAFADW